MYSSKIFSAKIPDEARNRTKKWQGRAIFKPNFAGLPARNCTVLQNLCGQNTTFEPPSRAWSALPRVNEMLERNFEGPIPPGVAGGFSPKITSSIYRLKICVHAEENLRKMWNLAGKSSQEVLQNSQLSRKNPNMRKISHVPAVCSPGPCSLRGYRLRTITFRDLTNGFPDRVCGPSHPRFQEKWTPFLKKPYLAEILRFLSKLIRTQPKKQAFRANGAPDFGVLTLDQKTCRQFPYKFLRVKIDRPREKVWSFCLNSRVRAPGVVAPKGNLTALEKILGG